MESPEIERCAHLIHHAGDRGRTLPGGFCECPAGLIHANDCPISNGQECVHFKERDGAPEGLDERAYEKLHVQLLEAFVSRRYFHRVRSLCPAGDAWHRRKARLEELYAGTEDEAPFEDVEKVDAAYVIERDKLIEARRKRDAARDERKQQEKDRAAEQARIRVKTVVERARDTVAEKGNVATSYLDAIELPKTAGGGGRRSKRRRGSRSEKQGAGAGEQARSSGGESKGSRGRRRRSGGQKSAAEGARSGGPQPGGAPAANGDGGDGGNRGPQGDKKRPGRRRRGRRGGRNRKKPE